MQLRATISRALVVLFWRSQFQLCSEAASSSHFESPFGMGPLTGQATQNNSVTMDHRRSELGSSSQLERPGSSEAAEPEWFYSRGPNFNSAPRQLRAANSRALVVRFLEQPFREPISTLARQLILKNFCFFQISLRSFSGF